MGAALTEFGVIKQAGIYLKPVNCGGILAYSVKKVESRCMRIVWGKSGIARIFLLCG